tara:strand:+ start:70 stop:402 length:333 start_codon:yes stop_codon:yes gene_type:complete
VGEVTLEVMDIKVVMVEELPNLIQTEMALRYKEKEDKEDKDQDREGQEEMAAVLKIRQLIWTVLMVTRGDQQGPDLLDKVDKATGQEVEVVVVQDRVQGPDLDQRVGLLW